MKLPLNMIVRFLLDLVCYASVSYICWIFSWKVPFVLLTSFGIIYLSKAIVYMVRVNKALNHLL